MPEPPIFRWGIVATGLISSWFVADLVVQRDDAKVKHIIQAIGSSNPQKGHDFALKHCPNATPAIYASYAELYSDPNVDCVYIGTPHSFHRQNCLDAIAAGKNVLCEKPFAINAREAKEVFEAAKEKGVFVAEAMWLRHRPIITDLRNMLFTQQEIGEIAFLSSQYNLPVDIASLPATSRYKDVELGAGSLLDVGIYPLTWALLGLESPETQHQNLPTVLASQTHLSQVEATSNAILHYASNGRHAAISSSFMAAPASNVVCQIHGSKGYIDVTGDDASHPSAFTVYLRASQGKFEAQKYEFSCTGQGFIYEADDTALDVLAHRKESTTMPWAETLRVMKLMDEIRRQGGTCYPQDHETNLSL
ncbi:dimeric dihydrodiol dehydrogenase [Penicillium brevicompactum]|uniref:D-xylose 1-dehydrogenase (NADP(+), D-xylono-1,5-lactone-forming) n=1 Tax=Penicillium brevicompactum TaxID=5074 RepID=A0A9W9R2R7_PENBR|nr:dimeric dihydrodiol dehydrogenase [Penicillium brevicompactum]